MDSGIGTRRVKGETKKSRWSEQEGSSSVGSRQMSQQPWSTAQGSFNSGNIIAQQNVSSTQHYEVPPATASRPSPPNPPSNAGPVDPSNDGSRGPMPMLPPLQRTSGVDDSTLDRRATRSLGVHAILNTTPSEAAEPRGVRRSASEMEERPAEGRQQPLPPLGLSRPPSVESSYGEMMSPGAMRAAPRRILTPRSPTLRNVASLGRLTGTAEASQSPFLSPGSRNYTVEPGSGNVPPLPTPPAASRAGYGFPAPSMSTPPLQHRRTSLGRDIGQSGGVSPGQSYRSTQHSRPLSPRMSFPGAAATSTRSFQPRGTSVQPGSATTASMLDSSSPSFVPISSSGGGNYQILTMPTHKGPVQIPVDVQAASKMADEKRKRNAGASARFRERRKLKEKEAATTIHRLETQLREATEDAEFYRRERDSLAQLLYQAPGGDRHFPRPSSPRRTRVPGTPGSSVGGGDTASGSGSGGYAFSESSENPRRTQEMGSGERNTRRRTTGYNLPPPPPSSSMSPAPTGYASTFTPITPAPPPGPQQSFSTGPHRYTSASGPPSEAQAPNTNPQLAPRPNVGPHRPPDHDRSWPPASQTSRGGPPSYR